VIAKSNREKWQWVKRFLYIVSGIVALTYVARKTWHLPLAISIPVATLTVVGATVALWSLQIALTNLMLQWKSRSNSKLFAGLDKSIADIVRIPHAEARKRALSTLANAQRFECIKKPLNAPVPESLPGSVRELFSMFSSVRTCNGEALLSLELVGPANSPHSLIRIGTDILDTEIAVRPGEEPVFKVDGSDEDQVELDRGGIPSVYHWILVEEEILYGRRDTPDITPKPG
jgi:hypothetical protein